MTTTMKTTTWQFQPIGKGADYTLDSGDMENTLKRAKATPSQAKAVRRIVAHWEARKAKDPVMHAFVIHACPGFLSLVVMEDRTDCEFGSPRHVFCANGGQYFVGTRGAIKVASTRAWTFSASPVLRRRITRLTLKNMASDVRGTVWPSALKTA